jgi:hypothetical protein
LLLQAAQHMESAMAEDANGTEQAALQQSTQDLQAQLQVHCKLQV